uniref:Uncharacterized protein n=1 Tax=Micrococcus phage Olihed TaxID=3092209 RepID=A0AAU6R6D8_9CAUD
MNTENPTFTFPDEPDFGVWTRAVDRVVDALELDFYPSEELVAELVAEHGLTDPDQGDQMQTLEDELLAVYGY